MFALCGLFVRGEPPLILMFVLDLYSWLGGGCLLSYTCGSPCCFISGTIPDLLPARLLTAQSRLHQRAMPF